MESEEEQADDRVRRLLGGLCGGGGGTRTLEVLAVLRREVLVQADGARRVREAGGLDRLVVLLRRGSERVLDSTLSALATCCLEEESCLTVGRLNVFVPLVAIVKTSSRDSVVGRACRLLGNLAQNTCNAESLHVTGAVAALLALLERRDKNTSYPTLTMLVRAVRLLWMVADKREEMLTAGAVRAMAVLLTAECESAGMIKTTAATWQQQDLKNNQEQLLTGLLKCLGYLTSVTAHQCAEQLQGEGRGYQCLVALTRTHESLALKCIMNLCYVSTCRPLLGTAGVVECLVGVLQKHSEVSFWPEGSARALAQLSEESVNRSRLRHCGGLPLLLAAARVSHHALRALLQYVFDDTAFQILIDEGLVSLLTDELTGFVPSMQCEHDCTEVIVRAGGKNSGVPAVSSESAWPGWAESHTRNDRVVIERDNMLVGFMDNASDEDMPTIDFPATTEYPPKVKPDARHKRGHKKQPQKCPLKRMASLDWCSSIYWEPKSPELPTCSRRASGSSLSPERSPFSPEGSSWCGRSPDYGGPSQSKRPRWELSPDSGVGSGEGAASPSWAGWSDDSPRSPLSVSSEDSESGLYSPVCSESESEEEEQQTGTCVVGAVSQLEEGTEQPGTGMEQSVEGTEPEPTVGVEAELHTEVLQELDDLIVDDDKDMDPANLDDIKSEPTSSASTSRIGCVLVLLMRVAHGASEEERQSYGSSHILSLLAKSECLMALLEYVERCRRPYGRAAKILARVLSNALSLMSLLRIRLGMKLRKMSQEPRHPPTKCKQCRQVVRLSKMMMQQLSSLAESEYGMGEICYQLHKGQPAFQQTLSVTLPYFVSALKPLRRYFVECNGLNVLFAAMEEERECPEDCIQALAKLSTAVKIRNPKTIEKCFDAHFLSSYKIDLEGRRANDEVITFVLDDLSTVQANKTLLCDCSEVFAAMLTGPFKESSEKSVRLQKATKLGFQFLLSLIQHGIESNRPDKRFPLGDTIAISLEGLVLADRFLFKQIRMKLRAAIVQFQLKPDSVRDIYVWSQTEGMLELCVEAVSFALVGEMTDAKRISIFNSILGLEFRQQWLNDVKAMIMQHASTEFREAYTAC